MPTWCSLEGGFCGACGTRKVSSGFSCVGPAAVYWGVTAPSGGHIVGCIFVLDNKNGTQI